MATMFSMYAAKCPQCAARLAVSRGVEEITCEYCGTQVLLHRKAAPKPTVPRPHTPVANVHASRLVYVFIGMGVLLPILFAVIIPTLRTRSIMESSQGRASEALLSTKIDSLIQCISDKPLESRDRYLSWVDADKGPTGKERYISYGLFSVSFSEQCEKHLRGTKPALPALDTASQAYGTALSELTPLIVEAAEYYDAEDYKDDETAKGKALHPQLMRGFATYQTTLRTLLDQLIPVTDALIEREIAETKEQGDMVLYWARKSLISAQDVLRVAEEMQLGDIASLEQEKFSGVLDQLLMELGELKKVAGGKELRSYQENIKNFLKHAKGLRRMAKGGKGYGKNGRGRLGTSSGWMTDNSPDRLRFEYQGLLTLSQRDVFGGRRVLMLRPQK